MTMQGVQGNGLFPLISPRLSKGKITARNLSPFYIKRKADNSSWIAIHSSGKTLDSSMTSNEYIITMLHRSQWTSKGMKLGTVSECRNPMKADKKDQTTKEAVF